MDSYIIADNEECISFDYFMNRLFEIINDCNHENYLGEVIIPFLRSCCIEETKIVPVYDDQASGPKTDNETEIKKRMKTICVKPQIISGDFRRLYKVEIPVTVCG